MKKLNLTTIKNSARELSQKTEPERNNFLTSLADILWQQRTEIIKSNQKDIKIAEKSKLSKAFIQRLVIDEMAIGEVITRLKDIRELKSNLGEFREERHLENGLTLKKICVPIGVIAVIYESRPEVTIDAAALCLKSGNAVILKGGSEGVLTNGALYKCIREALKMAGINQGAVSFVTGREVINNLLKQADGLDLVIARGGSDLVKAVIKQSRAPVMAHSAGGARIYIDKSADLEMAKKIIVNAKVSKPSACNCVDTILVHEDIAKSFLSDIITKLRSLKVEVLGDESTAKLLGLRRAKRSDWERESLDLTLTVKVVANVGEAIEFINKHSKKHSEGIIAGDQQVIGEFTRQIDSAALFINCSTRLHDGHVFGMGAEMGIATGKLHARGPVGLNELTSYKWEVYGNGQIRE